MLPVANELMSMAARLMLNTAVATGISVGSASRQGHTFVHTSAQLELTLPLSAQFERSLSPV